MVACIDGDVDLRDAQGGGGIDGVSEEEGVAKGHHHTSVAVGQLGTVKLGEFNGGEEDVEAVAMRLGKKKLLDVALFVVEQSTVNLVALLNALVKENSGIEATGVEEESAFGIHAFGKGCFVSPQFGP